MKRHIPNTITLINLFCGCCALACLLYGQFITAAYFILVGGIADYSDGFFARMLKVSSDLGKELDSLADMVSFGVIPGTILYMLLVITLEDAVIDYPNNISAILTTSGLNFKALPAFIIPTFACLRLAKFNLDTRQSEEFIGLNTPACTCFMVGLLLTFHYNTYGLRPFIANIYFLYALIPILSILLVAELPMISFKFKKFTWKGNEKRFIFIILSALILGFFRELGLSLIILIYVIWSLIDFMFKKTS